MSHLMPGQLPTKLVADLIEGDVIDLEGVDQNPDNQEGWKFEYAVVESVSTEGHESGGWADLALLARPDRAIIYLADAPGPAMVPADSVFEILSHREPFTGPDSAPVQR